MFEELKAYIKKRFADEFKAQGHHLTGAAEESVEFRDGKSNVNFNTEVWANRYVAYVDKGVKSNEIKSPFAPARIEGLTRFWQLRGLSGKEAKNAAYATAFKHSKEGMPTKGSYKYSTTGKRTGFTSEVTNPETLTKIGELISKEVYISIDAEITNIIQKANKKINL